MQRAYDHATAALGLSLARAALAPLNLPAGIRDLAAADCVELLLNAGAYEVGGYLIVPQRTVN